MVTHPPAARPCTLQPAFAPPLGCHPLAHTCQQRAQRAQLWQPLALLEATTATVTLHTAECHHLALSGQGPLPWRKWLAALLHAHCLLPARSNRACATALFCLQLRWRRPRRQRPFVLQGAIIQHCQARGHWPWRKWLAALLRAHRLLPARGHRTCAAALLCLHPVFASIVTLRQAAQGRRRQLL
jgi:hypothetical protein